MHHKCRDCSRDYLQCRMENKLMSKENLDNVSLLQCFKSFVVQQPGKRTHQTFYKLAYIDPSFVIFFCSVLQLGFAKDKVVVGAEEYDKSKEKGGYVAGKHISKKADWWFNRKWKSNWYGGDVNDSSSSANDNGSSS